MVSVLGLLREVKSQVLSARFEVHLLATTVEPAKGPDSLDGTIAPEADADRFLALGTVSLASDVVFSRDIVQVAVRALGQKPEVFRRAVDDVLLGQGGFCICGTEVAAGPGDECVCHFDRSFSAPAMR